MKKPHEDDLIPATQGKALALVSASDIRMVCVFRKQEAEEWERLLRAAPDMARAIIRHLSAWPTCSCGECARCDMQAAIAKAGVPIP